MNFIATVAKKIDLYFLLLTNSIKVLFVNSVNNLKN